MADEKSKALKVAGGVVAAGIVAGAGIGIFQLRQWISDIDKATEKKATDMGNAAPVPPELLTWTEVGRVKTGLALVRSFALLPDGTAVVAGEKKLRVMMAAGEAVRDIELADEPHAVTAVGSTVYVGLKDHVEVWDLSGKKVAQWPSLGQDAFITCLALGDGHKSLWVANAGWRIVTEYDLTGKPLREIGREDEGTHAPGIVAPSPHLDVALGSDGFVWISNPGRHELEAYDANGIMVRQWGIYGTSVGAFIGCCNPTDFAFLPDGRVITAEKGTPRVKIFNANGKLHSVVAGPGDFAQEAAGIDVAADAQGRVWVMDPVARELRIYSPKGETGLAQGGTL
jgi:hypothetical protein